MATKNGKGITLVELLVVLAIVGLLSTLAVNVYIGRVELARAAATKSRIHDLEVALATYEVDLGQYPPSGSGSRLAPEAPNNTAVPSQGCGYLFVCLTRGLNGDLSNPLTPLWHGPYIQIQNSEIGQLDGSPVNGSVSMPMVQILDAWKRPLIYIRSQDYATLGGTRLPEDSPFAATEINFNPNTHQSISLGPDGATAAAPNRGTDFDDIANFKNTGTAAALGAPRPEAVATPRPGQQSSEAAPAAQQRATRRPRQP